MLKDRSSSAIVAVRDIAVARDFYGSILGLDLVDDSMGEVLVFRTGSTRLVVYRSEFAGANKANAVVWDVGDEVDGMKQEGDVHVVGSMRLLWFKDPDGNILHLNNM